MRVTDINTFIEKCHQVHGDKYDYSKSVFRGTKNSITITCKKHGAWSTAVRNHLRGSGCPTCLTEHKQSEFIAKCKAVHGDTYDYSKTVFQSYRKKVLIKCRRHGLFEKNPLEHVKDKGGCRICGLQSMADKVRLTREQVIERCRSVHGNKYDYSEFRYNTTQTQSTVICGEHGRFTTTLHLHCYGRVGCPDCTAIKRGQPRGPYKDIDWFLAKARETHGMKYDYSETEFRGTNNKVKISCRSCGPFHQDVTSHLSGRGCPVCGLVTSAKKQTTTLDEFAMKARYCFRLETPWVGQKTKVVLYCETHGEFTQSASKHLRGQGCPSCRESHGESLIADWLGNQNVTFQRQKAFDSLRHKRRLKIDFWLPEQQVAIEFDGLQHKEPVAFFGGIPEFIRRQHRDKLKTDYCEKNRIKLVRIDSVKAIDSTLRRLL